MGKLKLTALIAVMASWSAYSKETVKVVDYATAYKAEFTRMVKTGKCTIYESPKDDVKRGVTHGCKDAKSAIQSFNRKTLRRALKKTIQ